MPSTAVPSTAAPSATAPSTAAPSTAAPSGDRAPSASPVAGLAGSRVSASSGDRAPSASPAGGLASSLASASSADRAPSASPAGDLAASLVSAPSADRAPSASPAGDLAASLVSAPSADRAPTAPPAVSPASAPSAGLTPPAPLSAPPAAPLGSAPSLLGVGIALPGPLDHTHGILHRVTGFPEWDGFPLRDVLAGRLGVPVVVDKDTNAAALGLAVGGEGGSFAYLHAGTGLGAGLVIGGAVHRGARTGAGEFGHQVVQLDGPLCGCGNRGCVEALCLAAVARGDLAEAARVLGVGAGNLVALLDVDLVLLGGRAVATAPEAFVRGVAAVLDERARRAGEEPVPVRVASGGVAEGAAQLVLGPVFGRTDG
ncbi:ROK family protein [Streptomyces sp. NPDC001617]